MNNLRALRTFITLGVLGMLNFHSLLAWECSKIRWRGRGTGKWGRGKHCATAWQWNTLYKFISVGNCFLISSFPPSTALCKIHCGILMRAPSTSGLEMNPSSSFCNLSISITFLSHFPSLPIVSPSHPFSLSLPRSLCVNVQEALFPSVKGALPRTLPSDRDFR